MSERPRPRVDTLLLRPTSPFRRSVREDWPFASLDEGPHEATPGSASSSPSPSSARLESVPATKAQPAPSRACVVLVAEDHDALRELTATFLRREGFQVIAAVDGLAALEAAAAAAQPVDLLVSDVHMPRMGGVELAERLLRSRPGLGVLLTSGDERPPITQHAFLPKPFNSAQLLEVLRPLVRGSNA